MTTDDTTLKEALLKIATRYLQPDTQEITGFRIDDAVCSMTEALSRYSGKGRIERIDHPPSVKRKTLVDLGSAFDQLRVALNAIDTETAFALQAGIRQIAPDVVPHVEWRFLFEDQRLATAAVITRLLAEIPGTDKEGPKPKIARDELIFRLHRIYRAHERYEHRGKPAYAKRRDRFVTDVFGVIGLEVPGDIPKRIAAVEQRAKKLADFES